MRKLLGPSRSPRFAIKVRPLDDESAVAHEVDVTAMVGTSNYLRCLEGMLRKVDLTRFFLDATEADAEHDRRILLVNPRAEQRGQGRYP
jgi:hypothetical protein